MRQLFYRFRALFASKQESAAVLDPAEEFRRELGLGGGVVHEGKQHSWFARGILAAHQWTLDESAAAAVFTVAGNSKKGKRIAFYTFLVELAVIAGVGSALHHPVVSSIPFITVLLIWIGNGIRLVHGSRVE